MAGVIYSGFAWNVVGGGRASHGLGCSPPPCGAGSRHAIFGASCARSSASSAYGGAASVGCQPHQQVELPGAPRSRARLAYCMTLEATGDEAKAQAAGRRLLAQSRARQTTLGCHEDGALQSGYAGGRMRRRGLPARRRKARSAQSHGCRRAEEAPSSSRHSSVVCEEASGLRQDARATGWHLGSEFPLLNWCEALFPLVKSQTETAAAH